MSDDEVFESPPEQTIEMLIDDVVTHRYSLYELGQRRKIFLRAVASLRDPVDQEAALNRAKEPFEFRQIGVARKALADCKAELILTPLLQDFEAWAETYLLAFPPHFPEEQAVLAQLVMLGEKLGSVTEHHVYELGARRAIKTLQELKVAGAQALLESAVKAARTRAETHEAPPLDPEQLRVLAKPVFEHQDPLELVKDEILKQGYGGKVDPAALVYLSATSRLLHLEPGNMPGHLLLDGPSGVGKSYTAQVVLRLLPPESKHTIDAGSPRVLIYDQVPLKHRILIFSEADSLPAGEDNPAASAVRNLLQDHHLHYMVVVRDPVTGASVNQTIKREGPTVMLTTSVKRLGAQMDTRLFSLEVREDQARIRAALTMRADIEVSGGVPQPNPALLAYQGWLQSQAPWDVVVPFARRLSDACGKSLAGARILRDFERLLSFIKAVAILRHVHRERQEVGGRSRLVATLEDYDVVYELVGTMYADTVGVPAAVRAAVNAVQAFEEARPDGVRRGEIANMLNLNEMGAWRHIERAIERGWLINKEWREHRPARLVLGDPMPEYDALPPPDDLRRPARTPATRRPSPPSNPEDSP